MHPILKKTIAVIAGLLIGGIVNSLIVMNSAGLIPPPEGFDLNTPEGLQGAMPLMEPKHFLLPFLSHALGTLVGAFVTAKIAVTYRFLLAMVIGFFFFLGGTYMVSILSAPMWFNVTDLLLAYFPMAWLGAKFAGVSPKLKKV